jgi:hypothetical protein
MSRSCSPRQASKSIMSPCTAEHSAPHHILLAETAGAHPTLWVPNWSSTLCDLGVFVYQHLVARVGRAFRGENGGLLRLGGGR